MHQSVWDYVWDFHRRAREAGDAARLRLSSLYHAGYDLRETDPTPSAPPSPSWRNRPSATSGAPGRTGGGPTAAGSVSEGRHGSRRTAQNLKPGILPCGSRAADVSTLAAASRKWNGMNTLPRPA